MMVRQCAESISNCGGSTSINSAPASARPRAALSTARATSGWAFSSIHALDRAFERSGRRTNRATGIGAEGAVAKARHHRGARAARGAAGDVRRIPGIAAIAPVIVVPRRPVGELGHVERADLQRADRIESLERRRSLLRY